MYPLLKLNSSLGAKLSVLEPFFEWLEGKCSLILNGSERRLIKR